MQVTTFFFLYLKHENEPFSIKQARVEQLFKDQEHLTEQEFLPVTQSCQLPEYMNMTLFRKLASHKDHLTLSDFTTQHIIYTHTRTRVKVNLIVNGGNFTIWILLVYSLISSRRNLVYGYVLKIFYLSLKVRIRQTRALNHTFYQISS